MAERLSSSKCPNAWLATSHSTTSSLRTRAQRWHLRLAHRDTFLSHYSLYQALFFSRCLLALCHFARPPLTNNTAIWINVTLSNCLPLRSPPVFRRTPRSHSGTLPRDLHLQVASSSLGCCLLAWTRSLCFAGYLPRLTGEARLGKVALLRWRKRRARRIYYVDHRIAEEL
jgi:hypothetical protein